MSNKRKRSKGKRAMNAAAVRRASSALLDGLDMHDRLRRMQRKWLASFDPMSEAFDEILEHFRVLARSERLDPELVHILDDAQRWVIAGVDRVLSSGDPHSIEEARLLLELEFLLKDFAAAPTRLREWADAEQWNRPANFGFGKLRQREERRQALDADTVIAARNYWITHSSDSHPKPLKDVMPPARHESFSLLNAFSDLMQHAWAALLAAVDCVSASGATIPADFYDLSTASYEECSRRAHVVLNSHIPDVDFEASAQPTPKKRSPTTFQYGADDSDGVG